jgi:hypothetical protein
MATITYTDPAGGTRVIPPFTTFINFGSLPSTQLPSDCLNSSWDFNTQALVPGGIDYYTQGCAISTCCPYGTFYTENWEWMTKGYSPGVCPQSYKTCNPPQAPLPTLSTTNGETVAFCCPNNLDCPNWPGPVYFCQTPISASAITAIEVDNIINQDITATEVATPSDGEQDFVLAYPIQIRYSGNASHSSSSQLNSTASQQPSTNSGTAISSGKIAGIVIGALAGLSLLLLGFFFMLWKIRKMKNQHLHEIQEVRNQYNTDQSLEEKLKDTEPCIQLAELEVPSSELPAESIVELP